MDREVGAEIRTSRKRRRNLLVGAAIVIALALALSLVAVVASPAEGETPLPHSAPPSPSASIDIDHAFPTGPEISAAIGVEVEAQDIESDLSQLWEGIDIATDEIATARMRVYGRSDEVSGEMLGMALIDVVYFRDAAAASGYGEDVALAITGPLEGFETELSAELVATGSWSSDDGFGGSTIVAQEGPVVVAITVAKAGALEAAVASEAVAALVLDRLEDDRSAG